MLGTILAKLRTLGIDVKSARRRDATSAMAVQKRVLAGREVRTIFDCGAHHGRVARLYRATFPGASIYAFEPTPQTYEVVKKNLEGMERVEVINAAVGDKTGEMDFFLHDDEQSNSLVGSGAGGRKVRVKVVSLGDFCGERKIGHVDVLKMDVEGYELPCLRGIEGLLASQEVDLIYCEIRFEPRGSGLTDFADLAAFLRARGYRFFGFYDAIYTDTLRFDWGDAIFVSERVMGKMG